MGLLRVGHGWATSLSLFTFMHWRRKGQPTQCSCLENPRDGGAWWAAIYGVARSQTWLKQLSSSSSRSKIFSGKQNLCLHGAPVLVGADNPALNWDMYCLSAFWGLFCAPKSWWSFSLPCSSDPVQGLTFRSLLTLQLCYLVFLDLLWWTQRTWSFFLIAWCPRKPDACKSFFLGMSFVQPN